MFTDKGLILCACGALWAASAWAAAPGEPDAATRRVHGAKMHYAAWHNDYCHAAVYKIFLKGKTDKEVRTTLDQAMDWIRAMWEITGGMHQIVYLVGWQHAGHDSKFPDFSVVGDQCRSSFSQDPRASLRAMMRAARKYNADVSLHINMDDAYTNSPLWQTYVDNDLLCRDRKGGIWRGAVWGGEQSTPISHLKEWRKGFAQKRVLGLLELLPEVKEARTIHLDSFAGRESPFEGITFQDDIEAIRQLVDFWHDQGIDVTTEFLPDYDQVGYFPFLYHYNVDERSKILYAPDLLCGGAGWNVRNEVNYYDKNWRGMMPGAGCVYEEAWGVAHVGDRTGTLGNPALYAVRLFQNTILYAYYNEGRPVKHTMDLEYYTVERANGVVSRVRPVDRALAVRDRGRTVVEDGDYFLDFTRDGARILACSEKGCDRAFTVPEKFAGAREFVGKTYPKGREMRLAVRDRQVRLKLAATESVVLRMVP